uniref:NADH dehydrogenase subunit 4L n=1 Tax=Neucentropus mandjuricus TaxID=1223783 RepID=UPI0021141A76|nr:NADH dehydrogenase subunit 4L [Neucentropus mandjuricus]USL48467.1 NADH dehydrogenase subunit 4L [Neucentropus mandjuricus]
MYFTFFIMFISGLFMLIIKHNHLLMMLLGIEFMMLGLLLILFYYSMNFNCNFFFLMGFLILLVVEGVFGLNLLILMIRYFGNDYFCSYNLLQC